MMQLSLVRNAWFAFSSPFSHFAMETSAIFAIILAGLGMAKRRLQAAQRDDMTYASTQRKPTLPNIILP